MTEENKETIKTEVIKLNDKTKAVLIGINQAIAELQTKAQLTIQTYLDALEKEGEYQLSKDMSMLVKKDTVSK